MIDTNRMTTPQLERNNTMETFTLDFDVIALQDLPQTEHVATDDVIDIQLCSYTCGYTCTVTNARN